METSQTKLIITLAYCRVQSWSVVLLVYMIYDMFCVRNLLNSYSVLMIYKLLDPVWYEWFEYQGLGMNWQIRSSRARLCELRFAPILASIKSRLKLLFWMVQRCEFCFWASSAWFVMVRRHDGCITNFGVLLNSKFIATAYRFSYEEIKQGVV